FRSSGPPRQCCRRRSRASSTCRDPLRGVRGRWHPGVVSPCPDIRATAEGRQRSDRFELANHPHHQPLHDVPLGEGDQKRIPTPNSVAMIPRKPATRMNESLVKSALNSARSSAISPFFSDLKTFSSDLTSTMSLFVAT